MDAIYQPEEIRAMVRDRFESLGVEPEELNTLRESLLVRDGIYYGRSYRTTSMMAMWMISVRLIQFYGSNGSMLGTICLGQEAEAQRLRPAQRQAA